LDSAYLVKTAIDATVKGKVSRVPEVNSSTPSIGLELRIDDAKADSSRASAPAPGNKNKGPDSSPSRNLMIIAIQSLAIAAMRSLMRRAANSVPYMKRISGPKLSAAASPAK
jgi:hypothetical protein